MNLKTLGIIILALKIILALAIGGILVVLVDTAWGQAPLTTPGASACILRPATILNAPASRSVIIHERLSTGWARPAEAVPYIAGISHIDEPAYQAATAAAAIQYSIALDPTGTLADTRIAAWIPDAPSTTLARVVQVYLLSGNSIQRNQAAARLVAAVNSPANDYCNGGK